MKHRAWDEGRLQPASQAALMLKRCHGDCYTAPTWEGIAQPWGVGELSSWCLALHASALRELTPKELSGWLVSRSVVRLGRK